MLKRIDQARQQLNQQGCEGANALLRLCRAVVKRHLRAATVVLAASAMMICLPTMFECSGAMSNQVGPKAPPPVTPPPNTNTTVVRRKTNKPKPQAQMGTLVFSTDMDCRITMDDAEVGTLDEGHQKRVATKSGSHSIKAHSLVGDYIWTQVVEVEKSQRLSVAIGLKRRKAEAEEAAREAERVKAEAREATRVEEEKKKAEAQEAARLEEEKKKAETYPTSTSQPSETGRPIRKPGGLVRTVTVDVISKRDWTSTGLIVFRGDRVRIAASGTVTLDPSSGQTSGPEGIDTEDPKKLMSDKPTGALIGVIGADNDDFIFIGRAAEFIAMRDGLLFLSVNEGKLADNSGIFTAIIETEKAAREEEEKKTETDPTSNPEPSEPDPPAPSTRPPVRTVTVDVISKRDWTSTGLIVFRGDRVRIAASGTVTLDPSSGQTSGPEGIDTEDPKKLMSDKPTGALIGVIGADNDDFIFIGRAAEFIAMRDGLLFLSVNEGTLADNSGIFKAVIEVRAQAK